MSAYIVSDRQISAILQAVYGSSYEGRNIWKYQTDPEAYHYVFGLADKAQTEANELMAENVRSVNATYPHRFPETAGPVQLEWNREPLEPLAVLKLIENLEYQTDSAPDYENSISFRLISGYRRAMVRKLAGYDAAPWSI